MRDEAAQRLRIQTFDDKEQTRKPMKQKTINILRTLVSDVRQAAVPSILVLLLGGSAGLLLLSRRALDFSIQLATTPTPLWATIALVPLFCGYSYLKTAKRSAKAIPCLPLVALRENYDIKIRLEPLREKLLAIVAVNKLPRDSQIAEVAEISEQLVTFHLNELKSMGLVGSQFNLDEYMMEATAWSVRQAGLAYLHYHGLLK
ncbi:MAG: hypothetical protein WC001_05570 [Desulfurivibrionaceae bacterium]